MRESPGVMEWWSNGALQTIKFQAPSLKVSGVRCQEQKTKKLKPEHCNLKPPQKLDIFTDKAV